MRKIFVISIIITSCLFYIALNEAGILPAILPQHEHSLAFLVPSLISIIICMMEYRHLRQVSHEEDERKQEELSQLRILLQEFQRFVQELRGASAFMQKLDERRAQFQNEMDTLKMFLELEDECQSQLENEMVSLRTIMKVEQERRAQFRNEMASLGTMMKMGQERSVELVTGMKSLKTIKEAENKRRVQVQ
jgi:hypothetical protein